MRQTQANESAWSQTRVRGELTALEVPIGLLKPFPGNPRRGDLGAVTESLGMHGQYRPVVVRKATNEVLAGNHVYLAALELGWQTLAATFVDVDEEQARKIVLVDNRTSDLANYETEELIELILACEELEGTGYDEAALDELLDEIAPPPLDEDDLPALPASPVTRTGELIALGSHRLVCGDARDPGAYERLLSEERPTMLWSDPPYGVNYTGKTSRGLQIKNDSRVGLAELLTSAFAAVDAVLAPGAAIYIAHPAGTLATTFMEAFVATGWSLRQTLVWVKDSMVLGRSDYHYKHEPLLYGFKPASSGRLGRGGAGWHGDNRQTSIFEIPKPASSSEHPTMKPVALVEAMVRNSSGRQDLVLDAFAGSGSTLIACERLGRCARLIEIDPGYCDVIVSRYEQLTGTPAQRRPA